MRIRHTNVAITYTEGEKSPQVIRDENSAQEVSGLMFHNGRHQSRTDTGRRKDNDKRQQRDKDGGRWERGLRWPGQRVVSKEIKIGGACSTCRYGMGVLSATLKCSPSAHLKLQ